MGVQSLYSIVIRSSDGTSRRDRLVPRVRFALLFAAALATVGCSPDFDWRETTAPGGEYRVLLPARPTSMTRTIHLEGLAVDMTMQGARVGETAFTVAVVAVPSEGAAAPQAGRLAASMREQMLRNIGAPSEAPPQPVVIDLIEPGGSRIGRVTGQAVSADGTGRHAGARLEARFVHWQGYALQAVVVGPPVADAQVEQFFGSLRLLGK